MGSEREPVISRHKNIAGSVLLYLVFALISLVVFVPLLITVFTAFKTGEQFGRSSALSLPVSLMTDNFVTVFKRGKMLLGFFNSMKLVIATVVINSLLSTMVAYCLSRFEFRFKKVIILLFLIGMIIPTVVTEIARFGIIKNLGLYNTIFAPIVIYAGTDLMQIYIYKQFIDKIPLSIEESAMLDGCNYFSIYWYIVFPMVLPATATLAIIKTVDVINDMYIPYLYMPSSRLQTMTTSLMSFAATRGGSIVELSAAVIIVMIPTLILYLLFQKYIFKGIVAGATKD